MTSSVGDVGRPPGSATARPPQGSREPTAPPALVWAPVRVIALPVKSLAEAKTRLAPILEPLERAALTLAMLEDALDASLALPGWESWVVSPDDTVLEVAARRGARAVVEETPTLPAAIHQVETDALGVGAHALAVLLPDIPLVTPSALTRAVHTLGPIVIAPALDEVGTNLLLRRPPDVLPAAFGADSYRRHLQAAAEIDVPVSVVERDELGFDLDVPDDILTVLEVGRRTRTWEVCHDLDAMTRLGARAVRP